MQIRTFRDLIAWQKAMEMARAVYRDSVKMPRDERFGLTRQMRDSAASVAANIAEGHGRQSRPDYIRFLRVARGSLHETMTHYELATSMTMMEPAPRTIDLMQETDRVLQGLIPSLEAKNGKG